MVTEIGKTKFGPQVAEVFVAAAEKNLCPYAVYADVAATLPSPTPAASSPTGPSTSFDDGTYEVGVDIVAGKYKTSGGEDCYWARLRQPDDSDIIANDLGSGPRTVIVRKGEYFKSERCGTWTKA